MPTTEHLTIQGTQGAHLAAQLERPEDGAPIAFGTFAHCFNCSKAIKAAVTISDVKASILLMDSRGQSPRPRIGHALGGAAVLAASISLPRYAPAPTSSRPDLLPNRARLHRWCDDLSKCATGRPRTPRRGGHVRAVRPRGGTPRETLRCSHPRMTLPSSCVPQVLVGVTASIPRPRRPRRPTLRRSSLLLPSCGGPSCPQLAPALALALATTLRSDNKGPEHIAYPRG
jgi:hypothetical protein